MKYLLLFILVTLSTEIFAYSYVPGGCGSLCMADRQIYNNYYPNYNSCSYQNNYWNGVHMYPHYQQPWRDPNRYYAQPAPYGGYGQCYNCTNYRTQPYGNQPGSIIYN